MILKIEKTDISPYIIFDTDNNVVDINGRMIMEDAISFFIDVNDHIQLIKGDITINFNVDYINSSSLSQLLKMLRTNNIICLNWYYNDDDYDSRKTGEIFKRMLPDIKINIHVNK